MHTHLNDEAFRNHEAVAFNRTIPIRKIDLSKVEGNIAVDLDDTVGDFESDMRQALAVRDGLSIHEALELYPNGNPAGIAGWWPDDPDPDRSYKEFLDLESRGLLYHSQPVRNGSGDVLRWLNSRVPGRVTFLTARPADFNDVSARWLRDKVGVDFPIVIENSTAKETVEDFEVLVDDSVPHVSKVIAPDAPHGPRRVVFMTRDRHDHKVVDDPNVSRAWNWNHVRSIFE